jgi:hypothetical protein
MDFSKLVDNIADLITCFVAGLILDICIICSVYFSKDNYIIQYLKEFNTEILVLLPGWFNLLIYLALTYSFGVIIFSLSSFVLEKGILKAFRKFYDLHDILSNDIYNKFRKKYKRIFGLEMPKQIENYDKWLMMNKLSFTVSNQFDKVPFNLYRLNRDLCIIFLSVGVITLIFVAIKHMFNTVLIVFIISLFCLSIISFYGFARNYRYTEKFVVYYFLNMKVEKNL